MIEEYSYIAALIIGFSGSSHCIYMCGSIAGGLNSLGSKQSYLQNFNKNLMYSAGRITSYSICGGILGTTSLIMQNLLKYNIFLAVIRIITGITMLFFAYYMLNPHSKIIFKIDIIGKHIWNLILPLARKFPVNSNQNNRSYTKTVITGMVWGWLPCGLVYNMFPWAIAAGSPLEGGLVMLCFGLGTLPALVTFGTIYKHIYSIIKQKKFRIINSAIMLYFSWSSFVIAFKQLNII